MQPAIALAREEHWGGGLDATWFLTYNLGVSGRQWEFVPQWSGHAGVGLELRLNRYTGIFADGRRVFPEDTPDYTLIRAGLRLGW